jgi:WhiB family transcriptional regulator, redox-sensing transcriptional regulator
VVAPVRRPFRPVGWWRSAACLDSCTEKFFPAGDDRSGNAAAKQVCAACPVTDACLDYALDNRERFGVWGGMTEMERRRYANSPNRRSA